MNQFITCTQTCLYAQQTKMIDSFISLISIHRYNFSFL